MSHVSSRPLRNLYALACLVLVIAALYFARSVLIPVVLAVLLAFMLSPVMMALERRRIPRVPAAITVVVATLLFLLCTTALVSNQLRMLMSDLPQHKEAIIAKIESLREGARASWLADLSEALEDINRRITKLTEETDGTAPTRVTLVPSYLSFAHSALVPVADAVVSAGLVLFLTLFLLLRREDMRNRIIRLWGPRRIHQATEALDDAGRRIGSFLLAQLAVNFAFGVAFGFGLLVLGAPYPLLGGFLTGLLRYVPFIGVWVAGAGPILLTLALSPGFGPVILVVAYLVVLEILFAQIVEPIAFGKSIGVSEVALLIALAFWGWLWGVAGLILATPLTAAGLVLARHLRQLRFLEVLLGDEPALKPREAVYQRLLANDREEIKRVIAAYQTEHPEHGAAEMLLLNVLQMIQSHGASGEIGYEDEKALTEKLHALVAELGPDPRRPNEEPAYTEGPRVLGLPGGDTANQIGLELFSRLLPRGSVQFEVTSPSMLSGELIQYLGLEQPGLVVVPAIHRHSLARTRLLVKRLRREFPEMQILVAAWVHGPSAARIRRRFLNSGANAVATSMRETRDVLTAMLPAARQANRQPAGS